MEKGEREIGEVLSCLVGKGKWEGFCENLKVCLVGGVEKWEDRKFLVFPCVYLVGGVEKWKSGKLFCLVEKKNERIENVVYIN